MAQARNLADIGTTISGNSNTNINFDNGTLLIDVSNNIVSVGGSLKFSDGTLQTSAASPAAFDAANTANSNAANASYLSVGTVPTARLGSGTANTNTYLRGDNSWSLLSAFLTINPTIISANTTAQINTYYVANSSLILTLPASPSVGNIVGFSNQSNTRSCIISGNGSNINGVNNTLTVDVLSISFFLLYVNATKGWIFV